MRIVDTCVVVDVLRGSAPAVAWFCKQRLLCIHGVTELELHDGFREAKARAGVRNLLTALPVIDPTELDFATTRKLTAELISRRSVKWADLLIATTAKRMNAEVVTRNARDFRVVKGLRVAVPYT